MKRSNRPLIPYRSSRSTSSTVSRVGLGLVLIALMATGCAASASSESAESAESAGSADRANAETKSGSDGDSGDQLGALRFVTSGASGAQPAFERGVAALHSFFYDEAADSFRQAQELDPDFAMAYWGEAMTYNHPIWSEVLFSQGQAALAKLAPTREERAEKAPTERERAWLAAVEILFGEGGKEERDQAYEREMASIVERWPDDVEAKAFWSLAIQGLVYGHDQGDQRVPMLMQAAAIVEELHDAHPRHPGVLHYLIHAYDDPVHAPLGLRAARTYAEVAPAAHHARHMPSHIFLQLGRWAEAEASNRAAWDASVAWVDARNHPIEKRDYHSLSWLIYVQLQQGRLEAARETLDLARRDAAESSAHRIHSTLESMEARWAIETGAFAPTADDSEEPSLAKRLEESDRTSTIYAVGYLAAREGDLGTARRAAERLRSRGGSGGGGRWGSDASLAMAAQVEGLVLLSESRSATATDRALDKLAEAVAIEDAMEPPSGPPSPMKPSHELYGEVLLDVGRPAEALTAIERSLARTRRRAPSLLALAKVHEALGNVDRAEAALAELREIGRTDGDAAGVEANRSAVPAANPGAER